MAHRIRIHFDTTIEFEARGVLKEGISRAGIEKDIHETLEEEGVKVLNLEIVEILVKPEGADEWEIKDVHKI